MKFLTNELMDNLCLEAESSLRKRKNFNFHSHEEAVQRLLNVMQPCTYIPPHKHAGKGAFEFFCALRGSFGVILFSEDGEITSTQRISAHGPVFGLEIPGETYHTLICLEKDSVLLEIKEGPYIADAQKHFLRGFPGEVRLVASSSSEMDSVKRETLKVQQGWFDLKFH